MKSRIPLIAIIIALLVIFCYLAYMAREQFGAMLLLRPTYETELTQRPVLYWRFWASQPEPVLPFFFLVLLINAILSFLFPKTIASSRQICRTSFWQSLLVGVIVVGASALVARCFYMTGLGTPLANLLLGVLELGLVTGLAVSCSLTGRNLSTLLALAPVMPNPAARTLFELFTGTFLISLLNLIPALGPVPPIGIRLIALLAILGMGAVVLTLRRL